MVEDHAACFEHMEKTHHELQEKHAKTQEDISQIMEMLATLTKGKKNVEAPNPQLVSIPLRRANEDPLHPPSLHQLVNPK